ncbi:hypothetical protein ACFRFL_30470 [Streptomyces sp. NPDC056708]
MRGSVGELVAGQVQCFVHDVAQVSVGQGVDDPAPLNLEAAAISEAART